MFYGVNEGTNNKSSKEEKTNVQMGCKKGALLPVSNLSKTCRARKRPKEAVARFPGHTETDRQAG